MEELLLDNFIEAAIEEWHPLHFKNYKGIRYYPFIKENKKFFMVYKHDMIYIYKDYKDKDFFILFCDNQSVEDIKEALSYV